MRKQTDALRMASSRIGCIMCLRAIGQLLAFSVPTDLILDTILSALKKHTEVLCGAE